MAGKEAVEIMDRIEDLAATYRRISVDEYLEKYPRAVQGLNMCEITSALALAAGQMIAQHCPEEEQGEAAETLVDFISVGIIGRRPAEDQDTPIH